MRSSLLLPGVAFLLLLLAPIAALAQGAPPAQLTDATAAEHVGKEAAVTGKVFAITTTGTDTTFLNFGGKFPNQTFTGVIFAKDKETVGDVKTYEGKTVTVTGKIELSREKPQIVIRDPGQIKLAGAATPSAPAPMPAPAPTTATPPAPAPAVPTPAAPAARPADGKKIALASNWTSAPQGGTMTRKDLALLFSGQGTASESTDGDSSIIVYGGIPFLTPLGEARKRLNLESASSAKARVTCPGLPVGSFTAHLFNGVFEGGFNRLILVTDNAEQVVSALAIDENSRQRVNNEPDSFGYHTYNFIQLRVKGTNDLVIKHTIIPGQAKVVTVDSMLIDPNDTDGQPKPRSTSSRSTTTSTTSRSKTGKVLERSRWYVPAPVVNLILRCAGGR